MNKSDLILTVQKVLGRFCTKIEAERALDAVVCGISQSLKKGRDVQLVGFGSFRVIQRKARNGVDPRNPKIKIHVAPSRTVRFVPGKNLKQSVQL